MSDLLFDVSWWIPALLALIGICLFFNGNKLQVARLRYLGLGAVGLAIVWILLGIFVDTGKKIVRRETRNFIQFAVSGEWAKFQAEMAPTASLVEPPIIGADRITKLVSAEVDQIQLKFASVQKLEINETGPLITANFDVLSQQDKYKPLVTTSWQMQWQETPSGWKIQEIRCLKIDGESADEIFKAIPRRLFQ